MKELNIARFEFFHFCVRPFINLIVKIRPSGSENSLNQALGWVMGVWRKSFPLPRLNYQLTDAHQKTTHIEPASFRILRVLTGII